MPPNGLCYYPDTEPGLRRLRRGRGFCYIGPDGGRITDPAELARIRSLAVPPAYTDVWISPLPNGHLLATGYDARGRKQYRYHPDWHAAQSETKYASLLDFGLALPAIRRRVERDLAQAPGQEGFALAAAVALIDRLALRVGGTFYARENGSFGALTLQRRHLRLRDGMLTLSFTAKGGKRVRRQLSDGRLMQALSRIRHLPGAELVCWLDEDKTPRCIASGALNEYLAEAGGSDSFTAKTFRTWAGTVAAFGIARSTEAPTIRAMAEAAAERLHNTPTIARKSYIHPAVIDLAEAPRPLPPPERRKGLTADEAALMAYLRTLDQ